MTKWRKSSHSIYSLKVHCIFCTKNRAKILNQDIKLKLREIIREVINADNVIIFNGKIKSNYVYIQVSIPPDLSVSKYIQHVKGISSLRIKRECPELSDKDFNGKFWASGFLASTETNIEENIINDYVGIKMNI